MESLSRRLPGLSALVAFEAAGRHLSFTRAARELHVTQAAVSRRIRALEERLGRRLFQRMHRAIQLTPEGRRLHHAVSMALGHIADIAGELRPSEGGGSLTVAATLAVSTFWLMPRIPRFRAAHPEIDVHVLASDAELEHAAERWDAGIRYGTGRWPGLRATLLARGEVYPVCSPGFLEAHPGMRTPADLLDKVLLSLDDPRWDWMNWPAWLAETGAGRVPRLKGLAVNSYPLLIQAAVEGQGVALGWSPLLDAHLARGELVRPVAAVLHTGQGFHLVWPEERTPTPEVQAFCGWLLAELGIDAAGAPARLGEAGA